MAGQVWSTNADGGYMYSDQLSRRLRTGLQPLCRFRQFCDIEEAFGLSSGDTFRWNAYSDVVTPASSSGISESTTVPETKFTVGQASAQITEFANSVPFTKKLDDLSLHPVSRVIDTVLKRDAAKTLDVAAYSKFASTNLTVVGVGTAAAPVINVTTNGTPNSNNNVALNTGHVKLLSDLMAERNIPAYDDENYIAIFRPRALRTMKDELEEIHKYVTEGWQVIMNGERGRYEGVRFVEQTNIPEPSGWNSPGGGTTGRGEGFFFGADTIMEAITIPPEIRGKIPQDFGRDKAIAWYALLGYGISRNASGAADNTIIHWTSQ